MDAKRLCDGVVYSDVNNICWEWHQQLRAKNIPVSGPLLLNKAKQIADALGHPEFAASNGWLHSFKKRHDISWRKLSGEAASTDLDAVNNWLSTVPFICSGYKKEDIFNADETGVFFQALPNRSLVGRLEEAKGGKLSKNRLR